MQRITDPTAVATLPPPPALTGTTGYFGPAVPGISAATRFRYWVANMWQEEMMSLLAAAGIAADTTGTVFNQVLLSDPGADRRRAARGADDHRHPARSSCRPG